MRDSWGQNFWTKDGWQIALTGCSRRSETWAQWTDVRAAINREVPTRMKRMTKWTIWFSVKEDQPWTHSTVREISWKTGIPKSSVVCIIRKDLQLKCFKRRRAQELTEAHCTTKTNTNNDLYTVSQKKQGTTILSITSPNVDRCSNFFHWQIH